MSLKLVVQLSRRPERNPVGGPPSRIDLKEEFLPSFKTLRVLWQAAEDTFFFKVRLPDHCFFFKKRDCLSKMATLFDPLGFLAQFIVKAKLLLQDLWAKGLDWIDLLGKTLGCTSRKWFEE